MILSEGRKEDVYNKFKKEIDNERILHSDVTSKSFYDFLVMDNFIQETNYKYLEPLVKQYYGWYRPIDDNSEPLRRDIAIQSLSFINGLYNKLIDLVKFFQNNLSKYDKKDLSDYVGGDFDDDFVNYTIKLREEKTNREKKEEIKKNTKRIFENDKVLIVKPLSFESSCYYGAGTKWCTTMRDNPSYYNDYSSRGGLYYIILKDVPPENQFYKIALFLSYYKNNLMEGEWFDSKDDRLTPGEIKMFMTFVPDEAFRLILTENKPDILNSLVNEMENRNTNSILNYGLTMPYKLYGYQLLFDYDFEFEDWDYDENSLYITFAFNVKYEGYRLPNSNELHTWDLPDEDVSSSGYIRMTIVPDENHVSIDMDVDDYEGIKIFSNTSRVLKSDNPDDYTIRNITTRSFDFLIAGSFEKIWKLSYDILEKLGFQRKFGGSGKFTFTKGSETITEFFKYMDSLPEGVKGSKGDFFVKTGKLEKRGNEYFIKDTLRNIPIRGYYSDTFAALRDAGILDPNVKQGFVKGPNYEKYKQRLLSNQK